MGRVWGGRRLETLYGKRLPADIQIGESWELVDRPEAQSIVKNSVWRGRALHQLWLDYREEVFGELPVSPRFPLLVKLLDARTTLSLQVHPPAAAAAELGGEPKTEFWYVTDAASDAELYVGLKQKNSRRQIEEALGRGSVEEHVHRIRVQAGDSMFLPSGRMHALGAGLVVVEIQQNSDTTYRVFDWDRLGSDGKPRELHVEESMRSIDFGDCRPTLVSPDGELLVNSPHFAIEKWEVMNPRKITQPGTLAIVVCLTGELSCAGVVLQPGEMFLVPASLRDRKLTPGAGGTTLLLVTIPAG